MEQLKPNQWLSDFSEITRVDQFSGDAQKFIDSGFELLKIVKDQKQKDAIINAMARVYVIGSKPVLIAGKYNGKEIDAQQSSQDAA